MQPAEEKISALKIFLMGLRSPESKRTYPQKLALFINDFLNLQGSTLEEQCEAFVELANKNGAKWVLHRILGFRAHYEELIEKGKIEASSVDNYLNVIKSFCDKNDDSMPILSKSKWTMIKAGLQKKRTVADVRAPTVEEIRELLKYWDPRIKPLVLTFISSGIRHQAWAYRKNGRNDWVYLRWGDVERIPKDETLPLEAAKMTVYNDEVDEEYTAFLSAEAYSSLEEWMKYRESYGEVITSDSYLMRDLWKTTDIKYGAKRSLAEHPRPLGPEGIKKIIHKGWINRGIRDVLPEDKRRHEFKLMHGFRMFFSSTAESCLEGNRDVVELLLGHHNPLRESYRDTKAKEKMLLKNYLRVVPELTINDIEKSTLQKQNTELKKRAEYAELKKNEFEEWKRKVTLLEETILTLSEMRRGKLSRSFIAGNDEANDRRDSALEMMERTEEEQWEREAAEKERSK